VVKFSNKLIDAKVSLEPAHLGVMAKRKREVPTDGDAAKEEPQKRTKSEPEVPLTYPVTLQIVAGSYDRVLHGITATLDSADNVRFADTFLFAAHASAVRCLALSPPSQPAAGRPQKVMLATGSSDERVNIFQLSAHPPSRSAEQELISQASPRPVAESSGNRELGSLGHHGGTVTRLAFPSRAKLLSASEDSTIGVTRTRDWSLLSSIRAPVPKAHGRAAGDTAAGVPAGINDFSVHPSLKVMISVSRGERCMRLWNLVTGKKAGALNFGREVLVEAGEGKHSTGEGRRVIWGSSGGEDEFAVSFDRNIIVFGADSLPKCKAMPDGKVKVHDLQYMTVDKETKKTVLAIATEDGRIQFVSTDVARPEDGKQSASLPTARQISQVGGTPDGVSTRIKEFAILPLPATGEQSSWAIVGGSSDGKVRVWAVKTADLTASKEQEEIRQVGKLLGTYGTENRITCLEGFVMIRRPEGVEETEDEWSEVGSDDDSE
jgi:protein MAK11